MTKVKVPGLKSRLIKSPLLVKNTSYEVNWKAILKKYVSNFFLKIFKLGEVLMLSGSLFQSQGAQTEKAVLPDFGTNCLEQTESMQSIPFWHIRMTFCMASLQVKSFIG